jgi:hypothetical protein
LWFCIVLLREGRAASGWSKVRIAHGFVTALTGPAGWRAGSSIARTRLAGEIIEGRIVKTKIHQPDGVH